MTKCHIELQIEPILTDEMKEAIVWLQPAIEKACDIEQLTEVELSMVLVNNQRIQELNALYRQKNQPTDVLSFPLWEKEELEESWEQGMPRPLGDIILSVDQCMEQAITYGHSLERELGFLTIHGFLHLLGYDHQTETEELEMIKRQNEILEQVGLSR